MKYHALTIDEQRAIRTNAYLTEAHLATTTIDDITITILQCQHKVIEVGSLSTPLVWVGDIHIHAQFSSNRGRSCRNG